jgi:hypothetical protein
MSNVKSQDVKPSMAYYDFYKTNGAAVVYVDTSPSMTRQEFRDECDINVLMSKYDAHVIGGPGNLGPMVPVYFDFADLPQDLMSYMEFMSGAEKAFMTLPAVVRKHFDNSALDFVAYASDPGNIAQMREWGLAAPLPTAPANATAAPAGEAASPVASPAPSKAS